MAFLKNKTQGNFVIVSQNIMHDTNLGLTERGLLITLLSLPDGWNLSIAGLTHILPDGKDKIAKALKTLTELGYLTREQGRTGNGKFGSNMLEIHETPVKVIEMTNMDSEESDTDEEDLPCPENLSTVNPHMDKPSTENPSQLNNKDTNNNKSNNKELNKQECSTDTLTDDEYKSLVDEFGNDTVDYQINRIKENHNKGCMNYKSFVDGRKLHNSKKDLQKMKDFTNEMCKARDLTIAEKGKHFNGKEIEKYEVTAWSKDKYNLLKNGTKKSYVADCAIAIIEVLEKGCCSIADFIEEMLEKGWNVNWSDKRKNITFENENAMIVIVWISDSLNFIGWNLVIVWVVIQFGVIVVRGILENI